MKPVRVFFVALSSMLLAACVTTTTGGNAEKWNKAERAALHTQMGVDYFQQGQVEVALEELRLALRIRPDSSAANHAMARVQLAVENAREAGVHFARAVRSDPENVAARNDYGFFLCNRDETDSGLAQFTAAIDNPLNNARYISLYGAGECERRAGNLEQAEAYYQRSLRLQPDLRPALLQLAYIHFDSEDHLGARAFLERFFGDGYHTAESLFLAVRNELALDRRDLASDYAKLLRTRFPGSERIDELRGLFGGYSG